MDAELSSSERSLSSEYNEGGYDYEFVDTPTDSLVCKICHFPSRDPHLSTCCGHTFCKSCLIKAKKSTALTNACPMCRTKRFTCFLNKQNERAVLSLRVRCTNSKTGCDWIGEVGDITGHLIKASGCKYEVVRCPNSCGKTFERQYLVNHVEKECPRRPTKCQYCHTKGEYQFIEGSHKQRCYKFPVPCPNNCEIGNVPSEHLKEHMKVCPLEVVQCQYHDIGCKAKVARKDLAKHDEEKTNDHLLLMKSALTDAQNKLADTKVKLANTETRLVIAEVKLANTELKLADTKEKAEYTSINTENQLADIEDRLDGAEGRLDGAEDSLDDTEQRLDSAEKKLKEIDQISELEATLKQKAKLFDTMFGEWPIKIHTQAAKLSSCNQLLPVIVKLPDFVMNVKNNVDWYSDPFYTHQQGYKMQLNVVPAGWDNSEGHYMSVYLHIMDGPFDHLLKWQLKGKFQVTLLNQICDSEHHSVSYQNHIKRSQSISFWYCEEFISQQELRKISATCQFVKDNCVFFEVRKL